MTSIKKQILKLEKVINRKFPDLKSGFYISRRNDFVHMGLDQLLFCLTNYANIISEINFFFKENLNNEFLVNYPYLYPTVT